MPQVHLLESTVMRSSSMKNLLAKPSLSSNLKMQMQSYLTKPQLEKLMKIRFFI